MQRFRSTIEAVFGAVWYLAVVMLLPFTVLFALGLWYLWQSGVLLEALLWWLVIAMSSYAAAFGWRKWRQNQRNKKVITDTGSQDEALPEQLGIRPDWSARDIAIWHQQCKQIEVELNNGLRWQQMQPLALAILAQTASAYHATDQDKTWRFTLPEALLVLEETSRRYRQLITEFLPFSEKITVASLLSLYDQQDNIARGLTWANRLRRAVRLLNPLGALLGEVRDLVTDRVFAQVSQNLQQSLQRLLLQEVAQVAIDLYSGRLNVGADELSDFRSEANQTADSQRATPAEPLRVLVFGQVSAGKSTLVNALREQTVAEADILPVTDRTTVHKLTLPGMHPIHLVDTPGYGVANSNTKDLVATLLTADIWVLVAQLNRPARLADTQVLSHLQEAIQSQPMRRAPPLVVVLSHATPTLVSAPNDPNAFDEICTSALAQLKLPITTPTIACDLTPAANQQGLSNVIATLQALEQEAVQVQFNRRRIELGETKTKWRNRLTQAGRLGSAIGGQVRAKLKPTKQPKSNNPDP